MDSAALARLLPCSVSGSHARALPGLGLKNSLSANVVVSVKKKRRAGYAKEVKEASSQETNFKRYPPPNCGAGDCSLSSSFPGNGVLQGNRCSALSSKTAQHSYLCFEKPEHVKQGTSRSERRLFVYTEAVNVLGLRDQDHVTNAENMNDGENSWKVGKKSSSSGRRGWKVCGGAAAGAVFVAVVKSTLANNDSSAHASCGDGGPGKGGPGSGNGGGWGSGGNGGQGGHEGGFPEGDTRSVFELRNEQDEKPAVSVVQVDKGSTSRPSLASLSSAAGDFVDGEAPIGPDYSPRQLGPKSSTFVVKGAPNVFGRGSNDGGGVDFTGEEPKKFRSESRRNVFAGIDEVVSLVSRPSGEDPDLHKKLQQEPVSSSALKDESHVPFRYSSSSSPRPQGFDSVRDSGMSPELFDMDQARNEGFPHSQDQERSDVLGWFSGLFGSHTERRSGDSNGAIGENDYERKALVAEVAALAVKLIAEQGNDFAKRFETNALRRLQREAFSDLVKVRERLDRLEFKTGIRSKVPSADSSLGSRTNLRGEVSSGGAFIVTEDSASEHSRASLQHAGLKTGLDVRFNFETPMREGDMLTTQVGVGQAFPPSDGNSYGGPLSLQKLNYAAQLSDSLFFTVAPLGARPSDISDTMNHLQGQALTSFAGCGPTLYQHCRGSALGASLRSRSVLLSMSQFLSGWSSSQLDENPEPLCLSTLAQFMVQPCDHLVLSLSAVNNVWPSPPSPTSSGLHWSEMGPLVLCKTITRPTGAFIFNPRRSSVSSILAQGNAPTESWSPVDTFRSRGIAMQSVALAGEIDLGYRVSLGGWAQVERGDWLSEFEKKEFQWNISVAKCTGQDVNWGLSVGRKKREDWRAGGLSPVISDGPDDPSLSQMQMEAFVRLGLGKGFNLQSGLVYIVDKHSQTPAFIVRSSWTL